MNTCQNLLYILINAGANRMGKLVQEAPEDPVFPGTE